MPLSPADRRTTSAIASHFHQIAVELEELTLAARDDAPQREALHEVEESVAEIVRILEQGRRQGSVSRQGIARIGERFAVIGRVLEGIAGQTRE